MVLFCFDCGCYYNFKPQADSVDLLLVVIKKKNITRDDPWFWLLSSETVLNKQPSFQAES